MQAVLTYFLSSSLCCALAGRDQIHRIYEEGGDYSIYQKWIRVETNPRQNSRCFANISAKKNCFAFQFIFRIHFSSSSRRMASQLCLFAFWKIAFCCRQGQRGQVVWVRGEGADRWAWGCRAPVTVGGGVRMWAELCRLSPALWFSVLGVGQPLNLFMAFVPCRRLSTHRLRALCSAIKWMFTCS